MNNWLKKEDDLTKRLKNSAMDFGFDPNSVKYRLLSSIENSVQSKPRKHHRHWLVYAGTGTAFLVFLSATFAFASSSKPGDKLFALNKLGEDVILNLPLPPEQKAKLQEHIVTSRLEALDMVQTKIEAKKLETIKESDDSLNSAVVEISKNKAKLEASGNTKSAAKLGDVLNNLQKMAQDHEKIIQTLEDETLDSKIKTEIRMHHDQIKNSGNRARLEIKTQEQAN